MSETSSTALPTLRLLTCGSVDDGKSTLIGRLLYEKKLIFDDQLSALERDSKKFGTTEDDIDFALLVDGLEAEREQGITIDVAYRYFATPTRSFIVADTPGHEQYTRNMATGASNADLADRARRRAQGPADPDAPPFDHRLAAGRAARRARGQQDRSRRLRRNDLSRHCHRTIASSPNRSGSARCSPSRFRPATATTCLRRARACRGMKATHLLDYLEAHRSRGGPPRRAVPSSGAMDQPPASRFSRLRRHDSERPDRARRPDRRRRIRPPTTVARIFVADREVESAEAGDAVTLIAGRRGRHRARRRAVASREPARGRRPVHRAHLLDERRADAARPIVSDEDRRRAPRLPRSPNSSIASTSTTSTSSPPSASTSMRSVSAISRRPCRSPSTPMPRTARPAPSSSSTGRPTKPRPRA